MAIKKEQFIFRSQRQRISPFPNYMSMESVCREMRNNFGINLKDNLMFFIDRVGTFFNRKEPYEKAGQYLLNLIYQKPNLYSKLIIEQKKDGRNLIKFSRLVNRKIKNNISNLELYQMYKKFEILYKKVYAPYGSVWIVEDIFNADLLKIIEKRKVAEVEAAHYLDILTTEPKAMVARIERQALWQLASLLTKNKKWVGLIRDGVTDKIKKESLLYREIKNHQKKFFWVTRDYEDPIISIEDIIRRLKECFAEDPQKEYLKMIQEIKDLEKERSEIAKKLKLNHQEEKLFKVLRQINYLKELRKRHVSESLYFFDEVLSEIGARGALSIKQVRFLRTSDIEKVLLKKVKMADEINKRIKLSVWFTRNGHKTQVFTGRKAELLQKEFLTYDRQAKIFTGLAVSPGVARGPVKIVLNPNEINKVKKGDVIVSIQVVPSFAPAILRAAALVCDGGHGITTHPAILAREAGIPCIIQTRFAREILKDGDMVEVDGYKGIVKKLNS